MTLQRSTRDPEEVRARLTAWLAEEMPPGSEPEVVLHAGIDSNGMSSETVVLDITATRKGRGRVTKEYVARVAPAPEDLPVFPEYRLGDQFRAMRLAKELAGVPVPKVSRLEETGRVLGTPYFLMKRIEGIVPPDVLPYTFGDNWLFDATPEDRERLQRASVEVLVKLHGIPDAASRFDFLDPAALGHAGENVLARVVAKTRAWYDFAVTESGGTQRSPLAERALAWLAANVPAPGETVLNWGDARIGNMMYRDFEPVAVLDWEMAGLGTREVDVAWMVFAHRVFQEIATMMGLPGMPDFLAPEHITDLYEELSGFRLGDLTWHFVLAATEWACVFLRTSARQLHFGEIERPEDPESVFYHRDLFARLLDEVGA